MKAAVFLILSLFSMTANATLDLTLPKLEYDPHFCQKNSCNFERERLLPEFEFKETTSSTDRFIFYTLNILDIWSTNRAISGGYGKEVNPLLPDYPSLNRLILHKTLVIGGYEYFQWMEDKTFVVTMNYILGGVVANNFDLIINNEYR